MSQSIEFGELIERVAMSSHPLREAVAVFKELNPRHTVPSEPLHFRQQIWRDSHGKILLLKAYEVLGLRAEKARREAFAGLFAPTPVARQEREAEEFTGSLVSVAA